MSRLAFAIGLLAFVPAAFGSPDGPTVIPVIVKPDEPPSSPSPPEKAVEKSARAYGDRAKTRAAEKEAKPADPKEKQAEDGPTEAEAAAFRAETSERLDKLKADEKGASAAAKALREVLEERLKLLDGWKKAFKERVAAENPEPDPAKQAAKWKAEWEQANTALAQIANDPEAVLPPPFRKIPARVPDTSRAEMKESIDSAQNELNDWTAKLERARAAVVGKDGAGISAIRTERDQTYKRLVGLKGRSAEKVAAVVQAKSSESEELAKERLINFRWDSRVEAEHLRAVEARLSLESKRASLNGTDVQRLESHVQLARKTLELMKKRYESRAKAREIELRIAAAREQRRAENVEDPLERFQAKRNADLLEQQALVTRGETMLATDPPPSLDQQRQLADRAEADLTEVKKLLDDGSVSHLDAIRLNNDFRRIGVERAQIVRDDLAISESRLTVAENRLSEVELALINVYRDDRFELENLLESLPAPSHPKAKAVFTELENRQMALLVRRRDALKKLASRAEATHEQILRRLRILDEHFSFIRTHMFWARDEDPIGGAALEEAGRELRQLSRASVKVAAGAVDPKAWGRTSVEFMAAATGLALLPWPLRRARRALRAITHPRVAPTAEPGQD